MKTTLPTLSEVVDITANMAYDGNFITNHIWDYNDFLKRPLKLEMFIPCKDGVPIDKPYDLDINVFDYLNNKEQNDWLGEQEEYQKALDRVIFKGFEIDKEEYIIYLKFNEVFIAYEDKGKWIFFKEYKSISDLEGKVQLVDKEYERLNL